MKILAVRVAEVARFSEPVALEGLSGGLDLLVGPNEAGKSTLLRALKAALFEKHRSMKGEIEALRPYGGGAPLIEVDLEIGGVTWRIRKRFLAERMAEVSSPETGRIARGADAEALLEQLLGLGETPGRFRLLWLGQGDSLLPPEPDEAGGAVLRGAVSREIAQALGTSRLRRLRTAVERRLGDLTTERRGQPKGRYLAATSALEAAEADLRRARDEHAAAEAHLSRLAFIEAAAQKVMDPTETAARARGLAEAEARHAEGLAGVEARERARAAAAEARAAHAAAANALKELAAGLADLAGLQAAERQAAAAGVAIAEAVAAAEAGLAAAAATVEPAEAGIAEARGRLKAVELHMRRAEIGQRLARAEDAARAAASLRAEAFALGMDEGLVREARRLHLGLREAQVRLEAGAARVTISYVPGAAGRILLDGGPAGAGTRLVTSRPLVLDMPGIGQITIEAGQAESREALEGTAAEARTRLAAILDSAGCADMDALERAHEVARGLATRLAEADAALKALAPEGLEPLAAGLGQLDRELSELPVIETPADVAAAERAVAAQEARLKAAAAALRQAEAGHAEARRQQALLEAATGERQRRLALIEAALPPADLREAHLARAEAAAADRKRVADETVHALAASEARAPDRDGLQRLEAEVARAREAIREAGLEAQRLAEERARIEGALEAVRQEDIASRLAVCAAAAERARAALSDITEEVQALQLLARELAAEEAALRESYLGPVRARLTPFLDLVFPGAALELDEGYRIAKVVRGGQGELLKQLSEGTREQLAVLVRLAFGRLLAEQGLAAPVVLDDALVYSDDDRMARMHRALESAAGHHQVIVLSCRAQAFSGLRGHPVTLVPWTPARSIAAVAGS